MRMMKGIILNKLCILLLPDSYLEKVLERCDYHNLEFPVRLFAFLHSIKVGFFTKVHISVSAIMDVIFRCSTNQSLVSKNK